MGACEGYAATWHLPEPGTERPCGGTATTVIQTACVHEHVKVRSVCDECADADLCQDYCGPCYSADRHVCAVTITPLAAVAS